MGETATVRLVTFGVIVTMLVGCADMTKEQVGMLAGAAIGGVVGHRLGGRQGTVAGLLIGGLIGNRIGAHLDEEDRKKLAALEQAALDRGESGSFTTRKTNARVSVTATPVTLEERKLFVMSEKLSSEAIMIVDPSSFQAYVDTPLYTALNESAKPTMVIPKGASFQVAANVKNEPWAVVGDATSGVGYVPMRYLKEAIASDPTRYGAPPPPVASKTTRRAKRPPVSREQRIVAAPPPMPAAPASVTTASLTSPQEYDRELHRLRAAYPAETSAEASKPAVVATAASTDSVPKVIKASVECKVVTRTLETGGGGAPLTESIKYCKEPPKGWQTQVA